MMCSRVTLQGQPCNSWLPQLEAQDIAGALHQDIGCALHAMCLTYGVLCCRGTSVSMMPWTSWLITRFITRSWSRKERRTKAHLRLAKASCPPLLAHPRHLLQCCLLPLEMSLAYASLAYTPSLLPLAYTPSLLHSSLAYTPSLFIHPVHIHTERDRESERERARETREYERKREREPDRHRQTHRNIPREWQILRGEREWRG